jgi:predicted ribonuclease YlaK
MGGNMEGRNKTYVIDTSVLIEDPDVLYKLGNSEIVIPIAVIKEIDGLKRNPDSGEPRAKAARKVARTLDMLGSLQDIATGARTSAGSTVRICRKHAVIDDLASNADNRIVGSAIKIKEETQGNVILVSTDGNMRTVTRAYGITAKNYPFHPDDAIDRPKEKLWQLVFQASDYIKHSHPAANRISASDTGMIRNIIAVIVAATLIVLFLSAR